MRKTTLVAMTLALAAFAACNGILGIDPAHLDESDAGADVVQTDHGSTPCVFDHSTSKLDQGCTFGP
ncbi:MAG: hypothetical protein JWM74_3771 [Myxococcaceae bacterium]|nr:hypothetical protein [Myxococcaceae bacterium]